jgi:hypothetical protein
MAYKFDNRFIGYPPIEAVVPTPAALTALPMSAGFIAGAEDPVWGPGEFIFARANGAIRLYGGCVLTEVWDATNKVYTYNATEWPTTSLIGRAVYVYQGNVALTAGQYGWFMTTGRTPVNSTVSIAADTTSGHNSAGQLTANAAGVQVVNARVITPATQTVVSAGRGVSGDTRIDLASTQGFFVGGYLSGTGVGASAIVTAVDPNGGFVLASVANSATVSGNVTITYNNATIFYNVLSMNRAFAQGAIT